MKLKNISKLQFDEKVKHLQASGLSHSDAEIFLKNKLSSQNITILDENSGNTISLNDLYKGDFPDDDELFWNFVSKSDLDMQFHIQKMSPQQIKFTLLSHYQVETIDELLDMLNDDEDRKELISKYSSDPNLENEIIVVHDGVIIDGNHRALAAAMSKKSIHFIDLSEDVENLEESDMLTEMHFTDFYSRQFVEFRNKYNKMKKDTSYFVNFNNYYDNTLDRSSSPKQDHKDPAGVYAYPLKYVIDHPMDIRYGKTAKYLRVLKVNHGGILHLQWLDMADMNRMFKMANKLPGYTFESILPYLKKNYSINHPQALWFRAMQLTTEGLQKLINHFSNKRTKKESFSSHGLILSNAEQTEMFKSLGFNAIEDRASNHKKAAINQWEPEQIILLDRSAFEIVEVFTMGRGIKADDDFLVNTGDRYQNTFIRRIAAGIAKNIGDSLTSEVASRSGRGGYAVHYTKAGRRIGISLHDTLDTSDYGFGEKRHKTHKTSDTNVFRIYIKSEKQVIEYQSTPSESIDHVIGAVSALWKNSSEMDPNFTKITNSNDEDELMKNEKIEHFKNKKMEQFKKGVVNPNVFKEADRVFGTNLEKYHGFLQRAYAEHMSLIISAFKSAASQGNFSEMLSDSEYRDKLLKIKSSNMPVHWDVEGYERSVATELGNKVFDYFSKHPDDAERKLDSVGSGVHYYPVSALSSFLQE